MKKLKKIDYEIRHCRKCPLYKTRIKAVPGEGLENAKIMFIGQAPGKKENETGKPFVGRAGKFLDWLLKKSSIKRNKCYITSIVKCFPPRNRIPKKQEAETCVKNYLKKQIKIINPKIIVLLGSIAKKYTPRESLENRKVIFTYHPSAGMRFPKIKKKMIKDFKKLQELNKKINI